jgi:hypothetical protein
MDTSLQRFHEAEATPAEDVRSRGNSGRHLLIVRFLSLTQSGLADQSGLAPENLTTLATFSVSSAISFPKPGERASAISRASLRRGRPWVIRHSVMAIPHTKRKSCACRLESATPSNVIVFAPSWVITVSAPICAACDCTAAKLANSV